MTITNVFVADLHSGSSVALCPSKVDLDDGGTIYPSPGQAWLRRNWEALMEHIQHIPNPVYAHVVGDAVEGDYKDRSKQMLTRNKATILNIARENIHPLAALSVGVFFYRGTTAHVGPSAELEEELAIDFDNAVKCPDTNTASWWSNLFECEGVRFDIMHHPRGSGGGRPMNGQGMIDRMATDAVFEYANRGERPPDLVIRGHIHQYKDSHDAWRARAITLPAWTLATEYIYRLGASALADVGAVLVHCSAGRYEVELLQFKPLRKVYYTV